MIYVRSQVLQCTTASNNKLRELQLQKDISSMRFNYRKLFCVIGFKS